MNDMPRRPMTDGDVTGPPAPPAEAGGWGGDGPDERGSGRRAAFTGLVVLLAATAMLFAAFTSALVVRRGISDDWGGTPKPWILLANTAVLLLSSAALEVARRALRSGARTKFNAWWTAGTALGFLFLAGQAEAWRELQAAGVFVATNPSSSFFYLLTAAHAVHLAGGLAALAYVEAQALRYRLGPRKRTGAEVAALFWHFLDGLWVYLMVLFWFCG
jgi:cytochrome c oxidase subunit III